MGGYQPHQKAGIKIWGEAALPTNHEKGCAESAKETRGPSKDISTGDKNIHKCMSPDEPHRFVKINLYRNYLQLKNLYT